MLCFALFLLVTGGMLDDTESSESLFYKHTSEIEVLPANTSSVSIHSNNSKNLLNSDLLPKSELLHTSSGYKNSINQNTYKQNKQVRADVVARDYTRKTITKSKSLFTTGNTSVSNAYSVNSTQSFTNRSSSKSEFSNLAMNRVRYTQKQAANSLANTMSESDLLAVNNPRQSVFILPPTGGNATEEDAVPLGNGVYILLFFGLIYAVFKLHNSRKIV